MSNSRRKCAQCKKFFPADSGLIRGPQFFCTNEHLIEYASKNAKKLAEKGREIKAKSERKELKERKDKLKSRSQWLADAQRWFNKFIRLRDAGEPCISCGRNTGAKMNAGHYRSVGSCPELRFEELNCHLQCEHCNSYKSGNIEHYRPSLIRKIGESKVEWIEGPHKPKKYTIDDIKEIISKYKLRCKEMEKSNGN